MDPLLSQLQQQTHNLPAEAILEYVAQRYPGAIAVASSFSVEDQVLTDMLARVAPSISIFTLDTGRLPQETYDLIDATRERYGLPIEVLFPDRADVEQLTTNEGANPFYKSIAARKACCHVRKVIPLRRKLATLKAWVTGLRREQSVTRNELQCVHWDEANGLVKVNPLANWTHEQVWDYIRRHDVPVSALHQRGYPSIGCQPCTRAVAAGEDIRAGRWWWESPEQKECGLHAVDGKLVRRTNAKELASEHTR